MYEIKGIYGYGNVVWLKDNGYFGGGGGIDIGMGIGFLNFVDKFKKFFLRKVLIFFGIFSFYRLESF